MTTPCADETAGVITSPSAIYELSEAVSRVLLLQQTEAPGTFVWSSPLVGGEWSASRLGRFTLGERAHIPIG
jgi:hypothetical protein